jgi:hypothetical protein
MTKKIKKNTLNLRGWSRFACGALNRRYRGLLSFVLSNNEETIFGHHRIAQTLIRGQRGQNLLQAEAIALAVDYLKIGQSSLSAGVLLIHKVVSQISAELSLPVVIIHVESPFLFSFEKAKTRPI